MVKKIEKFEDLQVWKEGMQLAITYIAIKTGILNDATGNDS